MPRTDHQQDQDAASTRGQVRILTIDGGGIRESIPRVLAELEHLADRRVHELFDLIVGTSTGAILALGLTRGGGDAPTPMSAAEIAEIYKERGPEIFPPGRLARAAKLPLGYRYDPEKLRGVADHFFEGRWLSECVGDVLIPQTPTSTDEDPDCSEVARPGLTKTATIG